MSIQTKLKAFRKQSPLSLQKLGAKYDLAGSFIWKLEVGGYFNEDDLKLRSVKKLAKMMELTLDELCQ